ncbi:MAG: antitoxin VapB family protein [Thermoplasmataceae archaeon]
MGSKNISISDEAYLRLSELKSRNESFTDVINRLTKKTNILDLKGILKEEERGSLEKNIKNLRKASGKRMDRIKKEIGES